MLIFLIWPALIGGAIAGGASLLGSSRANKQARRESRRNRSFQERMRNTEWQAAVTDMQAAGMNPALAYSQGGASTPSGSMANQQDEITPAVSSALQYKRLNAEVGAIKAGIGKTKAETDAIRGRPGRILEPGVDRGVEAMRQMFSGDTFSPRNILPNVKSLGTRAISSARSIGSAIKDAVGRIVKWNWPDAPWTARIGRDTTRRR